MPLTAAVVGAGATVYGASKSSKASNKAADAAQQSAAANNALQSQIYGSNTANLSPFMQRGNAAGDNINALLGLPTAANTNSTYNPGAGAAAMSTPDYAAYVMNNPDLAALYQSGTGQARGKSIEQFGAEHWNQHGQTENRAYTPTTGSQQQQAPQQTGVTPTTAQSAFDQYENSTGHQFRLQTGSDAISSNKATAGLLKSGSALKALTQYGQDLGTQDFQGYLGNLSNQQSVGLSGANALAGVGTNYANATSANNDSAASATGNAALVGAGQTNALLGQLAGAAGTYLGSSYGGSKTPVGYSAADQAYDRIPF